MKTYTIDEQNNITVFGSKEDAAGTAGFAFSSQKELAKLTAEWPVSRFIEIWNGFAGVAPFGDLKPIKKFTDRKVATTRIWQAIQRLDAGVPPSSVPEQPEPDVAPVPEEAAPTPESAQEAASIAPQVPDVAPEVPAATTDASPSGDAHVEAGPNRFPPSRLPQRSPSARRLPSPHRILPPRAKAKPPR